MRDAGSPEPPESPVTPPDDGVNSEWEERLRVSSLRPAASDFSMRRLLNRASLMVVAALLLALAIHWLPGVLPGLPNAQPTRVGQTYNAALPPARGTNWRTIGPDWAQDISFTSNGALGYACGAYPLDPIVFFGVYDVHQNAWKQTPTPATAGSSCQVFVSPDAGDHIVLSVDYCLSAGNCSDSHSESRLYASYDGGETWATLPLPAVVNVYEAAWANSTLFLAVRGSMAANTTTIPPNAFSHLLVSQRDGTFTEIDAQQLVGSSMQFRNIALLSSGTTLYVSLDGDSCASYCTIQVRSADTGAHWTPFSAVYQGGPIIPETAQPYSNILVGWTFLPTPGILAPLLSVDNGDSWEELPAFPTNPSTGGAAMFALSDGSIYAFCFGDVGVVYVLQPGARHWQTVAPLPTGIPLAVQYDASGHAVALWGRGIAPTAALGLEYYPLVGSAG